MKIQLSRGLTGVTPLSRGLTDGTYLGSAQDKAKYCPTTALNDKGKT
jgi:hypothetical protein